MRAVLLAVLVIGCDVPGDGVRDVEPAKPHAAGVDCRSLAQTITSLELGNYADPEVRTPREREIESLCLRARLTKADADCVLAATTIDELAYCPKPLVIEQVVALPLTPGDICEQYVRRLEAIARCSTFPPDSARALRGQIPTLRKMYAQYGSQKQVQDNCKMALDATDQAYKPLGC